MKENHETRESTSGQVDKVREPRGRGRPHANAKPFYCCTCLCHFMCTGMCVVENCLPGVLSVYLLLNCILLWHHLTHNCMSYIGPPIVACSQATLMVKEPFPELLLKSWTWQALTWVCISVSKNTETSQRPPGKRSIDSNPVRGGPLLKCTPTSSTVYKVKVADQC